MNKNYELSVLSFEKKPEIDEFRAWVNEEPKYVCFNPPYLSFIDEPEYDLPYKYIINKGATILFWDEDDEDDKTIVKLSKSDKFDKRIGFLTAYFQHHSGMSKTQANKYLDNLEVEDKNEKRNSNNT